MSEDTVQVVCTSCAKSKDVPRVNTMTNHEVGLDFDYVCTDCGAEMAVVKDNCVSGSILDYYQDRRGA
jgi:hypothetical protein